MSGLVPTASSLSPKTRKLLADAERRRMIEAQVRERKAAERQAVEDGVAERVALGEGRGEAFTQPTPGTVTRLDPVRRQSGLMFLANAKKLGGARLQMAAQYETTFALAHTEASIKSCLNDGVGGGDGPTVNAVARAANNRVAAQDRLRLWADQLHHQRDMLDALAVILGNGMTPREAGGNALRAAVYTVLVLAALDILVAHAAILSTRHPLENAA